MWERSESKAWPTDKKEQERIEKGLKDEFHVE
jgi:hypothetical protein